MTALNLPDGSRAGKVEGELPAAGLGPDTRYMVSVQVSCSFDQSVISPITASTAMERMDVDADRN